MKIYFKQLKNLDIYGIPIRVNFQNQEVYKTGFGALISIIVFSVFCLASYYQSSELISRSSPIVLTSEQFVKNPERMVFDKKQQIMIMGLTDLLGNNIYDPQVIQVSSYMTKLSKFSSDQNQILLNMTNLVVRPCDSQDIQSEKLKGLFSNLHLDYFFCFDDNQDVYIEGDLSGDFYSKIDVFFKQCKNSTQPGSVVCKPQEYIDKKTKNIYFLNYMVDKIVDPTNLESPFGYQKINIETQTSSLQSQQFTAYFQNYYIQSDTGLFSKQVNQVQDFQCVQTQSNYVFSEPGLIIQFTIRPYKNKQMLMQRRYMKFSDLAAQIGGLFKILTLIGFVIVFPFSKISLNKEIVNSLFEFNLKNDEQKSKTVYQSNCLLLEKNFIEDQGKLNEKKVKNCKQFMQINQHNQKNTVNQNIEGLSQFSHALDKTNNKNIQNSSLQNQESTIQQVTTSSPNNREVNKENLRLLQFTQFSEIDSLKLQNKEVAPNHAFRRKETQISLKKTKSNFSNQEAILNIFDKEMKQSNQMLLQSKKSLGTIGIQQISSLDQLPINHQFNQIEQYQEHCNVFKDDLRIGQINRGQWTREQTNNKCVESSIQPSMENFSEQDCQQIQKKDQTLQDQTNYLEDFQEKNNQSMAVDRFLKENQLLFNGDSKQESLNQSNQSPNLNFSKINESSDQINKSKVTSQRQHRPSYRFKPDELNNQLESGFKKRKNQKTQQTFGGTKFNSSESIQNEETLKQKSTKKLQSRTTQQIWKSNFFNILLFFNRFIYRNKQRLIYFKPQQLLRNQWDAINDLDPFPVILPYNKVSLFWDFVTISFIFINSFLFPFEIAFNNCENINPLITQTTQLIFMLNFLVQLNTAYYENGILQKSRSKIFLNFVQSHLLIDSAAYLSLWADSFGFPKLKIFFLIKYFSFYEIIEKLAESFKFSSKYTYVVDLLTLFVEITLLCHLFACAWFMLGDYQQSNYMLNNWVNVNNLVGSSIVSQYVSSIYFSVVTISTIGYGDIVAKSDIEKVFICFMAIFTSVIFSYILTNIQSVYKGYHSKRKVYIRHLAELNNYLYSRDVNPHLQQMARKYLKYVHTQNHQKRVLPNQTLNVLSKFLKEEIIEEIFKRSIKNIPFLQQFSHQFLNALAHKMKEVNYGPEEIIMKTGSYQVPWLYYIVQGRVEIQLDQSSIQNQKQSQFSEYKTFFEHKETESFGQYEFVSQTHQSQVNVKSLEQTTLHQILLTDFIEVLNQFQVDKEKYQELKDKLNLNENYSCVNVYCQSCKSSSHLLRDCPLFFYKPQKFKIVRLYNWQQEFERNLITRSTDRLILNSLAFQQEIEDDCIFFREENQEELGSMIQLEGDEEYKQKQKLTNQKRSSCDIQSLNLLQKEKPANSKISISIPRLSVQQSNNSALSTIQVEYKAAEIQNDEQKCDFQIDSKQEIQQPSTMNSIKKQTSQNKLENKSNQSIQSCISSHSSESDSSSSSSSSSISEKRIQKQLKQNIGSRKSINENCSPAQKSRMSLSRINTRQEFQKKATLLSARTKKNWSSLEKSKSLNDVQLLVRPSLTSQINLNDPKLATQVKQNYKRLITIGQMQHVLELMQMQNAQKVAKQMIENNEDITTETVRTFKIYMPHNNIGNIIKEYQKLKLKQKLKRKIIKTVDIDNSLNLNNK
ncbi:hypothetical protein ABPG73_004981 [Tetrahymena malaccensis]